MSVLHNTEQAKRQHMRESMLEREADPEFVARIAPQRAANLVKGRAWTEERRARHRLRMLAYNARPEVKARKAAQLKKIYADPVLAKRRAEKRRQTVAERSKDPAYVAAQRAIRKAVWTPEKRAEQSSRLKAIHKARLALKTDAELAEWRERRAARERARDALYRRKHLREIVSTVPPQYRKLYYKLIYILGVRKAKIEIELMMLEAGDVAF